MTKTYGVGGYKILDLSAELPFTGYREVEGAYQQAIVNSTNKPLLVCGARVGAGGTTIPAFFANMAYDHTQSAWVCRVGNNGFFFIKENDQINFTGL